jgi:phosphatidylglycerol:prolipoprotein diacylglycerol transferase
VHPVLFRIPGLNLPIHTYGVMIVTGFLLAMYVAWREAQRQGELYEEILDFAFWALVGGLAGARIVFIIVNWRHYLVEQPFDPEWKIPSVLVIWKGGLVFYGAALGGVAAFIAFAMKRNWNLATGLRFADIAVLGLPLAHVFGRFGCVAAGCCWGDAMYHIDAAGQVIADIPLAARFPEGALAYTSLLQSASPDVAALMRGAGHTMPLFPSQLVESFGEGVIFLILLFSRQRKWFHGQVILTYFLAYPLLRSVLEMFRGDPERGYVIPGVLSTSQFISLLVAASALTAIYLLRKRGIAQVSHIAA